MVRRISFHAGFESTNISPAHILLLHQSSHNVSSQTNSRVPFVCLIKGRTLGTTRPRKRFVAQMITIANKRH